MRLSQESIPYAPAGFRSTVSFISPDNKAAMVLAFDQRLVNNFSVAEVEWLKTHHPLQHTD